MAIAPDVETNAVHGLVTDTTARFLGTVNRHNSAIQSCVVEYGETPSYGRSISCDRYPESDGALDEAFVVGATAIDLAPNTQYLFRIVLDTGVGGAVMGVQRALETPSLTGSSSL